MADRAVLLDNEAVQALARPPHPKHRRVLAHVQVAISRTRKGRTARLEVPTAVRVEAGWDRTAVEAAFMNRLGIVDIALDGAHADVAAGLGLPGLSVADAHLGTAILLAESPDLVVLTSDDADVRRCAGSRPVAVVHV